MIKVVLIGQGNVASHLVNSFTSAANIDVLQVNSRQLENIPDADVTIIAVSDDAIASVSNNVNSTDSLVVHTSGTVSIEVVSHHRKGVFYPLQSFTKNKPVDFSKVPFCLESTTEKDLVLLEKLTESIQSKPYRVSTEQRKKLHLAAVFVNNFTNHMYKIGHDICEANEVPFEILHSLIEETAKKITEISPAEAQTGPAKRNDQETIQNHLENLNLHQQEMYALITKSIQDN